MNEENRIEQAAMPCTDNAEKTTDTACPAKNSRPVDEGASKDAGAFEEKEVGKGAENPPRTADNPREKSAFQQAFATPYVSPYVKKAKKIAFSKPEHRAAILCFLLGLLFARYAFWLPNGYFTTLTFWAIIAGFWYFLRSNGQSFSRRDKACAAILTVFSTAFSITDNGVIKFCNILFLIVLGAYWVFSVCEKRSRLEEGAAGDIADALLLRPFSCFTLAPGAALRQPDGKEDTGKAKYLLAGLIAAIPVTAVASALLISADEGVERLLNDFFENFSINWFNGIGQLFIGVLVGCFLFGMLYANLHHKNEDGYSSVRRAEKQQRRRFIPNLVGYIAVTPALGLYLLFFASQTNYFLSAFSGRLPQGMGYAEYARRGFFELFVLAAMNLLLLFLLNRCTVNGRRTRALTVYNLLLCVSTLLMIAIALSKMGMYISRFGLTRLRLYTSWTMVVMAAAFLLILIRQFAKKLNVIRILGGIFLGMFALLCFSQSDYWIARFNVAMYESGRHEELDLNYLVYSLSDDALGFVLKNCDLDEALYEGAHVDIVQQRIREMESRDLRFRWYNLASMSANRAVSEVQKNFFTLRLAVNTSQPVYGVQYEYLKNGKPLGSGGVSSADGDRIKRGEVLDICFSANHFSAENLQEEIEIRFWTLDENYEEQEIANTITVNPQAGEIITLSLTGIRPDSYQIEITEE